MEGLNPKVAIGLFVALLCLIGWVLWPVHSCGGKEAARKTMCLSNIKQSSTSLALYAENNNDRFPAPNWAEGAMLYEVNEDVFTCSIMSRDKKKWGYAMNAAVVGIPVSKVANPDKKVLLFETDALGKNVVANLAARVQDRHNGGSNVSRVDTSAKFVKAGTSPE